MKPRGIAEDVFGLALHAVDDERELGFEPDGGKAQRGAGPFASFERFQRRSWR